MPSTKIKPMEEKTVKLYRHYKNKLYKYIDLVKHSETLEDLVLYKPLENNPDAQLWVRPKTMFFEKINTEGQSRPRFESVNFKYVIYKNLDSQTTQDLMLLAKSYFTDFNESDLSTRLSDKKNILFLLVFAPVKDSDSKLVGFKIGFEKTDDTYYSWLGAVARDYKNLGIARELIKQQVMWCETMGYKFLETKTTNKWKEMLMLNLKSGFEITGTEFDSKKELKISLRKKI